MYEHACHFINGMKDEIQAVKEEAGKDFDWDNVENSSQYQTRAIKCAKRRELNGMPIDNDWKNDPGEKASCIWEWWRVLQRIQI